jgi:hypothetical protein
MLEVIPQDGARTQVQAGGSPFVAMGPVESIHRIILPRRSGESRLAPRQYWYAATKSGVMPSLPVTTSGLSQRDKSSDAQRDAA